MKLNIDEETLIKLFPFEKPRNNQLEIIKEVIHSFSEYDYVLLNAPTGTGKSPIAITIARWLNLTNASNSYVLTSEKILQNQYQNDFQFTEDISILKGRASYSCLIDGKSYENGICHSMKKDEKFALPCLEDCPYKLARDKAKKAPIAIKNYHLTIFQQDNLPSDKKELFKRGFTTCDEVHKLEGILLDFASVKITGFDLDMLENRLGRCEEYMSSKLPSIYTLRNIYKQIKNHDNFEDLEFYFSHFQKCSDFYASCLFTINHIFKHKLNSRFNLLKEMMCKYGKSKDSKNFLDRLTPNEKREYKELNYCLSFTKILEEKISKITTMQNTRHTSEWIYDQQSEETSLKPVYANYLFHEIFDNVSDKFLFMSATTPKKDLIARTFSINESKIKEIEVDSPFPIINRRIFNVPLYSMSYANIRENLPKMVDAIDELLDLVPNDRVLIHSGNYSIANFIGENSKHTKRLIIPSSQTREQLIEEEYKEKKNAVLISPSVTEGLSLNDDLCRLQIIVKLSFLSLKDRRVSKRKEKDNEWYSQETIFKLIQSCGRGVRHSKDYCLTVILDSAFNGLWYKNKDMFPEWYTKSILTLQPSVLKNIVSENLKFMKKKNKRVLN